jgi:hypothetical protein
MSKPLLLVQAEVNEWLFQTSVFVDDFEEPEMARLLVERVVESLLENMKESNILDLRKLTVTLETPEKLT